ncbi:hypothetical protein [uncultured Megamonas sp.]|uniref:hypothetical protein n=2 Tax=uncultured Megamonas sp. TaxID=286140 RepID=UPI0025ECA7D9|nr:hypothetical protein [uncultured Megamonas sp.]
MLDEKNLLSDEMLDSIVGGFNVYCTMAVAEPGTPRAGQAYVKMEVSPDDKAAGCHVPSQFGQDKWNLFMQKYGSQVTLIDKKTKQPFTPDWNYKG